MARVRGGQVRAPRHLFPPHHSPAPGGRLEGRFCTGIEVLLTEAAALGCRCKAQWRHTVEARPSLPHWPHFRVGFPD